MKIMTILNCIIIFVIMIFVFGLIATVQHDNAQKEACKAINTERIQGNEKTFCVFLSGNYAQEVIFDCSGYIFNIECKAIPVMY